MTVHAEGAVYQFPHTTHGARSTPSHPAPSPSDAAPERAETARFVCAVIRGLHSFPIYKHTSLFCTSSPERVAPWSVRPRLECQDIVLTPGQPFLTRVDPLCWERRPRLVPASMLPMNERARAVQSAHSVYCRGDRRRIDPAACTGTLDS